MLSVKNPKHKWVYALQPGQQFRLQSKIVRSTGGPCADQMPKASKRRRREIGPVSMLAMLLEQVSFSCRSLPLRCGPDAL